MIQYDIVHATMLPITAVWGVGQLQACSMLSQPLKAQQRDLSVTPDSKDKTQHESTDQYIIEFTISTAHLIYIWAEAVGVAIAQNIRVVTRAGHVHLASKSL